MPIVASCILEALLGPGGSVCSISRVLSQSLSCPVMSWGCSPSPPSQAKGAEPFLQSPASSVTWSIISPDIEEKTPPGHIPSLLSIPLGRAAHSVETLPRGDRGASGEGASKSAVMSPSLMPLELPSQLSSVSSSPRSKCPHSMGSPWCSRLASWAGSASQSIGGLVGRREPRSHQTGPKSTQGSAQESLGSFQVLSKMLFCPCLHEFTSVEGLKPILWDFVEASLMRHN